VTIATLDEAEQGGAFDLSRAVSGAAFVNSVTDETPAVWGDPGGAVAWSKGEGLMLVGPEGVGKSTLAQQLMLARLGLRDQVLGMTVEPAIGRVLYIAADRPKQAARSLRRMIEVSDEATLDGRLIVWPVPLPFDFVKEPKALLAFIAAFGDVSDVFIDSLKDVAFDLAKDETGSRVNVAFQTVIAAGIELVVLHHQRKATADGGKPRKLADVYGSRWLTAGMGSVILVWGEAGDLVVELRHLKQPAEEVGPLNVQHDHAQGRSTLCEHGQQADLEEELARARAGLLVRDAASIAFESENPTPNEIEKTRRKLNRLVAQGRAERRVEPDGQTSRYFITQEGA
jgi:replicative DNA helicase